MYVDDDNKLHFVNIGGADSVIPFSNTTGKITGFIYALVCATSYSSGYTECHYFDGANMYYGSITVYLGSSPDSCIIGSAIKVEYNSFTALIDGVKYSTSTNTSSLGKISKNSSKSVTLPNTNTIRTIGIIW